jgi:hypothetical protein
MCLMADTYTCIKIYNKYRIKKCHAWALLTGAHSHASSKIYNAHHMHKCAGVRVISIYIVRIPYKDISCEMCKPKYQG